MKTLNANLNRRERRAQALLAHYATCERLAKYLGVTEPDGKRISVALLKIEREANRIATAYCNGESTYYKLPDCAGKFDPNKESGSDTWENFTIHAKLAVGRVLNANVPALFVNGDARGYACKIDNETPEGKALIESCKLHTDWGGFGILSPTIDGD